MNKDSRIYVAGHRGLVGSNVVRRLKDLGYTNVITRTSKELNLTRTDDVNRFFDEQRPEYVFLAAAKVGGIKANIDYPADFMSINLAIQMNVIDACHVYGAKKLLFLGSSCIYPNNLDRAITESDLMSGPLESTNDAYAVAKIAGIKMCQAYRRQHGCSFICAMPTNLYGPGDNYHPKDSHVFASLIRKFSDDDLVTVWGTGKPRREFMHAYDCADALVFLMDNYDGAEPINVGTGEDISIADLAHMMGYIANKAWTLDGNEKVDGTARKLLDVSRLHGMGWRHRVSLEEGVKATMESYKYEKESGLNERGGNKDAA
jgi:GDP-L-fucose synthase